MIDLHTHTLFSDGCLLPSELVYRAKVKGYTIIGIADHVDFSTIEFVVPKIAKIAKQLTEQYQILVVPGAEVTYVPPQQISEAVRICRKLGAKVVIVHGETIAETVPPGTNLSGILSGADILAHPGKISKSDVQLAKQRNVLLEITAKLSHRVTDAHVASLAKKYGAKMIFGTDTHNPENLIDEKSVKQTLKLAKLTWKDFLAMQNNAIELIQGLYPKD
ncbi:MAG: PHP domain-containing protein [Elusimicrobia bacterium RIFOXYA2_FULL_40_6]|nr:MAG: PHP domain-containing protein [Elusimicrobia bacterium RIFOXYA2_FULL_40_6]